MGNSMSNQHSHLTSPTPISLKFGIVKEYKKKIDPYFFVSLGVNHPPRYGAVKFDQNVSRGNGQAAVSQAIWHLEFWLIFVLLER